MAWTAEDIVRRASEFTMDREEEVVFQLDADLSDVSDEELESLAQQAVEMFDALYERSDEEALTDEDVESMQSLADALDTIRAEQQSRADAQAQARERADALAARVRTENEDDDAAGEGTEAVSDDAADASAAEVVEEAEAIVESAPEPVTASTVRVRGVARRRPEPDAASEEPRVILAAAADVPGFAAGQELSLLDVGQAFATRNRGMSRDTFRSAHQAGKRLRQQYSLASIRKPFPPELVASGHNDGEVLDRAADVKRLPGGSLTASGGWCAPSEVLYDLFEVESTDGLISVPEIQVTRGGIRHTPGPDFSSIFDGTGYFTFTEEEDVAGDYDGYGDGEKPFMKVDCPEFVDDRLNVAGVNITAGILQDTAYPETIERFLRGALVAHEHKMAERIIGAMVAQSTVVTMPADPVGALAPTLQAIEVQIEDYRQRHRLARATSLEVILPYWVRGAIRSDLSRRLGVEMTNVSDTVIGAHFTERGASVQFVYNFDDLDGAAASRTSWPNEVKALIYAAGTFVRGTSDVITLDAVYDSALFRVNDYTALFTEEGWLVAKRGHDSRVVTIPICADGHTSGGVAVDCDGSQGNGIG